MRRVTGLGGVFFKARDKAQLIAWYRDRLGIDVQSWGGTAFEWRDPSNPEQSGTTAWAIFDAKSTHFAPSTAPFMINYRVDDLDALLAALKAEGVEVDPRVEESDDGRFGWVMDPEGHRIELWQPPKGR
jgi:catechol 2,3-dioxygenase-like lactoylglutathione lyase family enzyme